MNDKNKCVVYTWWCASSNFGSLMAFSLDTPCPYPWRVPEGPALEFVVPSACPLCGQALGELRSGEVGKGWLPGRCRRPGTPVKQTAI